MSDTPRALTTIFLPEFRCSRPAVCATYAGGALSVSSPSRQVEVGDGRRVGRDLVNRVVGGPVDATGQSGWLDLDVGDDVSQPAISPDGTTLGFIAGGRLAVRKLDQTRIMPIGGTAGAWPFVSPDGRGIGYFARHELWKAPAGGGQSVTLCDAPLTRGATWAAKEYSSLPETARQPAGFECCRPVALRPKHWSRVHPVDATCRMAICSIAATQRFSPRRWTEPPRTDRARVSTGRRSGARQFPRSRFRRLGIRHSGLSKTSAVGPRHQRAQSNRQHTEHSCRVN